MTSEPSPQELVSGVYLGRVRHLRRHPRRHGFQYEMGMLVLDLDEVPQLESCSRWFSATGWAPLSFRAADYLRDGVGRGQEYCVRSLKKRVELMLVQLGAKNPCSNILFAGQIRHFGLYFSPVNFFFCYQAGQPLYLLAEVSNTPWNERHYYLVDLAAVDSQAKDKVVDTSDKVFHVSPFMDLNMKYFWRVIPPAQQLRIGIDNQGEQRLFSASLELARQPFTPASLATMVRRFPLMTGRIIAGIYWQALRLFVKGIPFVGHPGGSKSATKSGDPQR